MNPMAPATAATRRPMRPNPRIPQRHLVHLPRRRRLSPRIAFQAIRIDGGSVRRSPGPERVAEQGDVTYSTTAWVLASGVWTTSTPRAPAGGDVDVVDADAGAGDDLQRRQAIEQRGSFDVGVGANHEAVDLEPRGRRRSGSPGVATAKRASLRDPGFRGGVEMFGPDDEWGSQAFSGGGVHRGRMLAVDGRSAAAYRSLR